ncbi:MAG: hypothetical protein V2A74_02860, partial [bacterium]
MLLKLWAVGVNTVREMLSKRHFYALVLVLIGVVGSVSQVEFFDLGERTQFGRILPLVGIPLVGIVLCVL